MHYVDPIRHTDLTPAESGLKRGDGFIYKYAPVGEYANGQRIPVLLSDQTDNENMAGYEQSGSAEVYDNFLDWLFGVFDLSERETRLFMLKKMFHVDGRCRRPNEPKRYLVTGAGTGHDLEPLAGLTDPDSDIYAQDISLKMMEGCAATINHAVTLKNRRIYLSVSNASYLPFADNFFDGVYHFGGINYFPEVGRSISEMNRVAKVGCRVVFGDEGVAPWLKDQEYGKMLICNNRLWAAEPPLTLLPPTAADVNLTWIIGNGFYVVNFRKTEALPYVDIDRVHVGTRGGSIRSRYFGQLEGVPPELKARFIQKALAKNVSVAAYLERLIENELKE
jgi:ubiquinone/menaquinone biosynthesis C-methylase UbiE